MKPASKQGTSLLFDWPSIKACHGILAGHEEEDIPFRVELYTMTLRMHAFGGFSVKPLAIKGTWPGIRLLADLQTMVETRLPKRKLVQLSKDGPRWKLLVTYLQMFLLRYWI